MEVWDLYTEGRIKTGETHLRGTALPKNRFHLVVHVWIVNAKGEYLILSNYVDTVDETLEKQFGAFHIRISPKHTYVVFRGMCRRLRVARRIQCGRRCAGGQGRGRY